MVVVEDDDAMRASIEGLLRASGWTVEGHASARAFLDRPPPPGPACLVLDLQLPDLDGLELQRELLVRAPGLPIVFITGHGDIPSTVRAMKAGAVEFLTKPFEPHELLAGVADALRRSASERETEATRGVAAARHAALTPREREVMAHVVAGRLNKQIAAALGLSEGTVKLHRGNVMRKMEAESVADLVRAAALLPGPDA